MPYYSGGFFFGNLQPLNSEFKEQGEHFAKIGIHNGWHFAPLTSMIFDINFFLPDGASGVTLGLAQAFMHGPVSPFAGGGVGFHYLSENEDRNLEFGERFGPSANLNAGLHFFRTSSFQVRVRVNYDVIMNKSMDQGVGGDMAFIFTGSNIGVRKLKL
jgi:hypothetical protein